MSSIFYLGFILKIISTEPYFQKEATALLERLRSLVGDDAFSRFEEAYHDLLSSEIYALLNEELSDEKKLAHMAERWIKKLGRASEPLISTLMSGSESAVIEFIIRYLSLLEDMSKTIVRAFENRKERIGRVVARASKAIAQADARRANLVSEEDILESHPTEYTAVLIGTLSFMIASIASVLSGAVETHRAENLEIIIKISEDLINELYRL